MAVVHFRDLRTTVLHVEMFECPRAAIFNAKPRSTSLNMLSTLIVVQMDERLSKSETAASEKRVSRFRGLGSFRIRGWE